jgi:hypothetical protein
MRIKLFGILIVFSTFWSVASGQAIIKGMVSDSLGKPIPYTQIMLKSQGSSTVIAFSQSNSNGQYFIKINTLGDYMLEFRAISHQIVVYPITIVESQLEQEVTINPVLKQQSLEISEVIVMGERPITIKRDTVIFLADAFAKGDEQVAEDLLKQLPGMTVTEHGTITWQGKEIEKIMIEGDDIFGKGYRMVSRNIHAGVIDKVEVYERYSHNPLLKDIEESDRVALNLTLKNNVHRTIFGNASLGYSTIKTHTAKGSLMSFARKRKFYLFENSNSIGFSPVGDISHFINPVSEDDPFAPQGINTVQQYFINLWGFSPTLKEQRVRDNSSHMLSLSTILKPSDRLSAKLITFATYERDNYFRQGYQSYNIGSTSFVNNESHSLTKRISSGFGKLELSYKHSPNSILEYQGQVLKIQGNSNATHILNQIPANENLKNSAINTSHQYVFTKKISPTAAFVTTGRYQFDQRPEDYSISTFTLEDLFQNINGANGQSQTVINQMQIAWVEAKTIWRVGEKYIINARSGSLLHLNSLKSQFLISSTNGPITPEGDDFKNNIEQLVSDSYLGGSITRLIGNLSINTTLDGHFLYQNSKFLESDHNEQSLMYIEPKLSCLWQINRKNELQLLYLFNASPSSMMEIMSGFVLTGSRMFQKGTGNFSMQRAHINLLRYNYGTVADLIQIQTSFLYITSNRSLSSNSNITQNYSLLSLSTNNNRDVFMSSATSNIFLKSIRSNLKLKGNISSIWFENIVNDLYNSVNYQNIDVGIELRSAFKGIFNFHMGSSWIISQAQAAHKNQNINNYQFFDVYLKLTKAINVSINSERHEFGDINSPKNPWHFIDVNLIYSHKPNKLSFALTANNILNNTEFGNIVLSEISEFSTTYRIVPRHIMLRIDYRF